ncbi:hypothetical protein [Blastococcus sp. CCUG 61487]|uniref:hypothetical protein n=1 Tax=Blastococcus sp. CCUG 61487 TaxID=1840703 RepID=UPI00113EFBF9|nr:hypothetical protein [Blastococcus sp. CCUG 61487]TKJ28107.1 hypothetical protein A6V29_03090 [Blastococcus sp. CCUG 61487]
MSDSVRTPPPRPLPGARLVLRRAWWVVAGAALGLALGSGLALLRPPLYDSTAYLTVTSPVGQDAGTLARGAQALARLGTSPGLVGPELRAAGLPDVAAAPERYVRVQAAPDAPVFSVTGTSDDPAEAQRIAETVSQALIGVEPLDPFQTNLAAAAPLPREPTAPRWVLPVGGTGIAAGLTLVAAATVPQRRAPARKGS